MRIKEGNKERDILEAAIKVFAEFGYHRAKISKIAETANVAAGSVYVYYKNKESILLKIFEDLWQKIYSEFKLAAGYSELTPSEIIDSMIDIVFDVFTENPALARVFVNEQNLLLQSSGEQFTDYYEKFLREAEKAAMSGIRKGSFSKNIDLSVFRIYILGAIRNLLLKWAENPKRFPLNKIRRNVKFLCKYGIIKR